MTSRILKRSISGKGGLTLIEAIVAIAIFSIVIGAAGRFIIYSLNSWKSIQSTSNAVSGVNNVVLVMEKEVRQAISLDLDGTDGSRVDIYTGYYGGNVSITYLVHDDALWRIDTNLLGAPPISRDDLVEGGGIEVIPIVRNIKDSTGNDIEFFDLSDSKYLRVRFEVINTNGQGDNHFVVNTSFTVRYEGAK